MQNKTFKTPLINRMMNLRVGVCAGALFSVFTLAHAADPLVISTAQAIPLAPTAEPKLTYKAPGAVITIEELTAAQRKKLEEDYYKKAGYTSTIAPVLKSPSAPKSAGKTQAAKAPASLLHVAGIYGTQDKQQAEIVWNGTTMVVEPGHKIGAVLIESIGSSGLTISYAVREPSKAKKSKAITYITKQATVKTGAYLEVPV